MKPKIKFNSVEYKVTSNKNDGFYNVTECHCEWQILISNLIIPDFLFNQNRILNYIKMNNGSIDYSNGVIIFKSIGKSIHNQTDNSENDEVFARRLAFTRAQRHAFKIAGRFYNEAFLCCCNNIINKLCDLSDAALLCGSDCDDHAIDLINNKYGK